jgi:hypothetical protein
VRRPPIALVVVLLSLVPCSVAAAQVGPQLPPGLTGGQPTTTAPTTVVNPDANQSGGMSTRQLVLIFGSAMAVLGAIAWIILRDAHRAAPVEEPKTPAQRKLSARERERQQRAKRDKAKAARQQRKRNRPR